MHNQAQPKALVDPGALDQALARGFQALADRIAAAPAPEAVPLPVQPPMPPPEFALPAEPEPEPVREVQPDDGMGPWMKPGSLWRGDDGRFWRYLGPGLGSEAFTHTGGAKGSRTLGLYCQLRDAFMRLLAAEQADEADGLLGHYRAELNTAYDALRGHLRRPLSAYSETVRAGAGEDGEDIITRRYEPMGGAKGIDPDHPAILGLEHYDPDTGDATKAAIFTARQIRGHQPPTAAAGPAEALAVSMWERGRIEPARVCQLLDIEPDGLPAALEGLAYLSHSTEVDRWVPAAEYLSGNVRQAHADAVVRAQSDPRFLPNVAALAEVIPEDVAAEDIAIKLGVPWLTPDEVLEFLAQTLNVRLSTLQHSFKVGYHPAAGWMVDAPGPGSWIHEGEIMRGEYGTERMPALRIAGKALLGKTVEVWDSWEEDGRTRRARNPEETMAAQAKLEALNQALVDWMMADPARCSDLVTRYNRLYRSLRSPEYDPWPRPPGLAEGIELRRHQSTALARALHGRHTEVGLYHVVGAGKTLAMASIVMEWRRLGLARKPLLAVPNHLVEQIASEFRQAYPGARVLVQSDKGPAGRARLAAQIAAGDWDCIVVSHEVLKAIPVSDEAEVAYMERMADQLRDALRAMSRRGGKKGRTEKDLEKRAATLEAKVQDLRDKPRDLQIWWEQLGIDALLVDEAHFFKNLQMPSTRAEVASSPSQRATDLDLKIQLMREGGGRVNLVLATGTPISNSFAESWVMMHYLQPQVLEGAGVGRFDEFVAQFGRAVTDYELRPTGEWALKTRMRGYVNVPDLQLLFRATADVRMAKHLDLPTPAVRGGERQAVTVAGCDGMAEFVEHLAERAQNLGNVPPTEDNWLKIYNDGRLGALHLGLVGWPVDREANKVTAAADLVHRVWAENKDRAYNDRRTGAPHPVPGGLVLVFMDRGTPDGARLDLYEMLRTDLVARGVPAEVIATIHEHAKNKPALFERCRTGGVQVLIGSTEKMGTGMNVQDRAVALVHMDPPWRPADIEQREGRLVRQGNQNTEVQLYSMIKEGSMDALMYQGLEGKARMVAEFVEGDATARTMDELDDDAGASYAMLKALATGDERVVELMRLERKANELEARERDWARRERRLRAGVPHWRQLVAESTEQIAALDDLATWLAGQDVASWPLECFRRRPETWTEGDQMLRAPYRPISHRPDEPSLVGQLGPWRVTWHTDWRGDVLVQVIDQARDLTFETRFTRKNLDPKSNVRLWQRIAETPAKEIGPWIARLEDRITGAERDLAQAEKRMGGPFPDAAELARLRGEAEALAASLRPAAVHMQREEEAA
ncbi:MAG: hypothetical protein E6R04_05625 [Spirochaetes bacterium]|nr:MAG: hypothetical protein E6R04_05625 [Spirochaetota bacterium]